MIKLIQKNIILLLLIELISCSKVFSIEPRLIINTKIISKDTIPKEIFGGFIELVEHFVNGPRGHWAQEITNRGFDIPDSIWSGTAKGWKKRWFTYDYDWTTYDTLMYNRNGKYSQKIIKESDLGEIGISQQVFLNDSVGHNFYIYYFSNIGNDSLRLSIYDSLKKSIVYSIALGVPDSSWKKGECYIPAFKNSHKVDVIISFKNKGFVNLDEISLMPENNFKGIRKEFFDFYNLWKPGLLRYPGGCFADSPENRLLNAIGPIDQRKSPNLYCNIEQRMDFGINEFFALCQAVGAEPHITVNYENGSPILAAEYVEYCNGNKDTFWGKKRMENGIAKPLSIKYWEVGNEQWKNDIAYAKRYLEYYFSMKNIDSTIKIIIDGNHWIREKNTDSLFSIVGNNCDIYGYHPAFIGYVQEQVTNDTNFLSVISASYLYEKVFLEYFMEEFISKGLYKIKQGYSEWWTTYSTLKDWMLDSAWKNSTLESGLICASSLNSMMKYPESFVIGARTMGLGMIRCSIDNLTGKRYFYATPSFYAEYLLRNHHGKHFINLKVECDTYTLPNIKGFWTLKNTPYIDATVTASEDTLFINLLNRYPNDSKDVEIVIDRDLMGADAIVYELYSDSFLDANTPETPNKVTPKQKSWTVTNSYTVPAHSFTILAIPCKGIINVDDSTNDDKMDFHLYPNPAGDLLSIDADFKLGNVKIYNLLGSLVLSDFVEDNKVKINLSFLASGLYIAEINNIRKLLVKK
jgi:alpha-N-arabinofuranosidase